MTEPPAPRWEASLAGLRLGTVVVTFQRYRLPPVGKGLPTSPVSLGALPVAAATDKEERFALPLADEEGFWIAALDESPEAAFLKAAIRTRTGSALLMLLHLEGLAVAYGVPRKEELDVDPFGTATVVSIDLELRGQVASVDILDYKAFQATTGCELPEPLDDTAGYTGWKAP